ncbi:hypothetical protein LAZ67_X001200 [Cordylochernes scorpioides]|uniref:Uncharacterized protein n=1 Tax=Cordylochernes scorpioides TaxID=51811 RepID=A0ABY6LSI3_9ARAC|nr:hypothetical protein LAZ67_X001200 [Cordylochernes scorpioides]
MTFRREWFKTYTPFTSDHPIYLGDNSTLLAEGMGDIEIQAYVDGGWYNTYIRNVLYSPQLKKNLYSLSTSTRRGFNVIIKHDKLQIFMDNDLKAVGVRHDGLYRMLFKVTSSSQGYITSENKLQLWHERLAHLPVATLREMATKGLVDGLQPQDLEGDFFFSEGCQLGKAHRKSCYPSDGKNYQLGPAHCTTVKNIFRYLKGTPHMGILFTGQDQLVGYSDSDFARDVDSRKSTTGYAFMMNGGTVSWASQRQPIIALSTTESEYIAACSAAKELIWIRRLLQGIGCDITKETELYIDNQAAIKLVENPVFHKRTKHIDVHYHFIRSKHEEGGACVQDRQHRKHSHRPSYKPDKAWKNQEVRLKMYDHHRCYKAASSINSAAPNLQCDFEATYLHNTNKLFGVSPSDIDKYSRVVFPVCFVCFNLMYWIIYLYISDEPTGIISDV